jgi:Ca2+-binding EF-hand superfamily protein
MVGQSCTGLPFLPGNSFQDVSKTSHSKRQIFNKAANGIQVIRDVPQPKPQPPVVPPPPQHSPVVSDDVLPAVPAYVALDRMVLRFFGYFKEAVHESRLENFRVRKVTVMYYLEDNTIQVNEPKEENSGIPQGAFIKRHHVPKGSGEFYTVVDLALGTDITFYGRSFRIVDCDAFTAQFFEENQLELGQPEDYPTNPHDLYYTAQKEREVMTRGSSSVKTDDLMHWTEAMLGRPTNLINEDKLAQFLKYDRKVLRFYSLWDDTPSLYGEQRKFVLHYYLADDTVEIVESYKVNSGRDPFPMLLARQKMPVQWDRPGRKEFYSAADLQIGSTINVFGRELLICDSDDFTSEFMERNFGHDTRSNVINLDDERPSPPLMEIPPYTGFGSEEDSLGSFYSLVPKAPKANWAKYFENDKKILRFVAQLDTRAPEDRERLFIVPYYLADDTIIVYEPPARNSGIMGGKWMERCRVKMPGSTQFYTARDLHVGQMMEFRKHQFRLIEADEYTLNFMENKKFPASDITMIVERLKEKLQQSRSSVRAAFRKMDGDGSGALTMDEFREVCKLHNFNLSDQELISLMRKFDKDFDGVVRYDEFCDAVLGEEYGQQEASTGGQMTYGQQDFSRAEDKVAAGNLMAEEHNRRQEKLMQLVNMMRVHLHDKREEVAGIFQQFDAQQDGQIDREGFAAILQELKKMLPTNCIFDDEEVNLMLESFSDPDCPDQTRPMSIAVLDQALFA